MEFEENGKVQRIVVDVKDGYWRRAQVVEENGRKTLYYLKADGSHHELENVAAPVTESGYLVHLKRAPQSSPAVERSYELDRNIQTIESEIKLTFERRDRRVLEQKLKSLLQERHTLHEQHSQAIQDANRESVRNQRRFERETHFLIPAP
jgi:hypothetical protein